MGKKSKTKGKVGELEAAHKLGDVLGTEVTRAQQYKGGQHAADLAGTGRLHVEVKRTERFNAYEAMSQAASDAGGNVPVVIHRRNRQPWLAIVFLDDLPALVDAVEEIRQR